MSTTVLLGLTSFEKIGGQWIFGGASDFSNLLAPWASGSRSLMLRAVRCLLNGTFALSKYLQASGAIPLISLLIISMLTSGHYFSTTAWRFRVNMFRALSTCTATSTDSVNLKLYFKIYGIDARVFSNTLDGDYNSSAIATLPTRGP